MIRKLFIITALFVSLALSAKEQPDPALYNRYLQLFNTESPDSAKTFFSLSRQLQQFYLKHKQMEDYYNVRRFEVRYKANHRQYFDAIKDGNSLLADMRRNGDEEKYCDIAYSSLGTTYIRQGNNQMAIHYFNEALKHVTPADTARYIHAYAGLGHAYILQDLDKALQLNEQLGELLKLDSTYYKIYLAHKVQIYFYKGDKKNFLKTVKEYETLINSPEAPQYKHGENTIRIMENAMTDRHDEVLQSIGAYSSDVGRLDATIRIYDNMGRQDLALNEAYRRMAMQDSFNNELLNANQKELAATLSLTELREKAAKEREFWMTVVIVLLVIAFSLLVSRHFIRRRFQKRIVKQNEQLEIALDEAKESERMKATFIKHISHEMRTPLNILTGYVHVIADPNYDLPQQERDTMLEVIDQNTAAMTNIINDLLEISVDASKERYRRDEQVMVNDVCRSVMHYAEEKNKGRLALNFHSDVSDDFTIQSNREGIERILKQLMKNALKFTEKGSVDFAVDIYESEGTPYLRFAVSDTGIGIPEEHHEQVFEQFYKVDSFKQGLGIGLPMSRKIAIRLGGTLAIDKDYHDGTRMVLTIPM